MTDVITNKKGIALYDAIHPLSIYSVCKRKSLTGVMWVCVGGRRGRGVFRGGEVMVCG